jgi:Patched family
MFVAEDDGNVLTRAVLRDTFAIHEHIMGAEIPSADGKTDLKFADLCARVGKDDDSTPCVAYNPAAVWGYNRTLFDLDGNWLLRLRAAYGSQLGKLRGAGNATTASAILLNYALDEESLDGYTFQDVQEFERLLFRDFHDSGSSDFPDSIKSDATLWFYSPTIFQDTITAIVDAETGLIVVSAVLVVVFMALVLGQRSWVGSKISLGCSAMLSILLSLVGALGWTGIIGVAYTPISPLALFVRLFPPPPCLFVSVLSQPMFVRLDLVN